MRIVFMGTPDFAVPSLQKLLETHQVCGVYTQPDKPKGRKQILTPPPVKEIALQAGIPVFQPASLRNEAVVEETRHVRPDNILVVAYGKLLPKAVLDIPPKGCINVHGSLLPQYRGAAPIQWAVINGDTVSGVTTMFMGEGLDTGDILLKSETEILPGETAGELFDRLAPMGAELLLRTLEELEKGTLQPIPQKEEEATYAPMLTKESAKISWENTAVKLYHQILGLNPWPIAYTIYQGQMFKIYSAAVSDRKESAAPGSLRQVGKKMFVCCKENTWLELLEVQSQGGKRMSAEAFLQGHAIAPDAMFETSH